MFSDFDSPEDVLPTAANARIVGKFRPKARTTIHKPITPPVNPPNASQPKISPPVDPLPGGDAQFLHKDLNSSGLQDAMVSVSSGLEPSAICNTFTLPETEEHVGPTEASLLDAASSGNDMGLQNDQEKSGEEAVNLFSNMESLDFLGQPNTATSRSMGKFRPKVNSQIRGKNASSSSIVHDATDSINVSNFRPCSSDPIDSSSAPQVNQDLAIHVEASYAVTEEVTLRSDMETVDDILDQPTTIDSHLFCPDEVLKGVQCNSSQLDQADCPLFESPLDTLSQPNTNIARGRGKFQPKLNVRSKNAKPIAPAICDDDHLPSENEFFRDHAIVSPFDSNIDSSATWTHDSSPFLSANEYHVPRVQVDAPEIPDNKSASPGSNKDFQSTHEDLERVSTSGRKRKPNARAKGNNGTIHPQNLEPSQDAFDEGPIQETDEENISGKSLMQLRKRKAACSPVHVQDDRTNENSELEQLNNSQIGDDCSDDEYNGQEMPRQKRVTGKPKRVSSGNEKLVRKRKNASEGPDPVTQETSKKKFTHSTRRNKRRVDKILLETPEEDIDRASLRIKDLIMLAEFNERKSIRDEAALKQSFPNQSFSPNESNLDEENPFSQDHGTDVVNDEASHQVQPSSTKLNYHTYMTRTRKERWSKSDTELFYQAVRQFGTDFAMIQQLFPNRTRHQVKLKFKNEERKHPLQIADVLVHRSQDHSHFELVIQQLQSQAEQNSNRDTTGDPMAESPRGTGENEEEESGRVDKKEEHEVNDWECGHSPRKSNEIQDIFDWNQYDTANDSLPRDAKKDEYERF